MTKNCRHPACSYYLFGLTAVSLPFLVLGFFGLLRERLPLECLLLCSLTLLTSRYCVRIPGLNARISVVDALIFANLMLFGVAAGSITAALVGLLDSSGTRAGSWRAEHAVFNMSALGLGAYLSGWVFFALIGQGPLWGGAPVSSREMMLPAALMAVVHYLLNSGSVALMVALEARQSFFAIWREGFMGNSISCFAGAFAAGLIGINAGSISPALLAVFGGILIVLYYSYKLYFDRFAENSKRLQELNTLYLRTIETLGMAIDAKDQITHGHVRRVQIYARELALAMGVKEENELRGIEAAALLHDIGKLAIPEYILNKPGELTRNEFQKIMVHPTVGADILASIHFPYPVAEYVRHHHEHWDGSGYPDGLTGTQIPLGARVIAVADCYEALSSDRAYRAAFTRERALQIIRAKAGKHYDPKVVDEFVRILDRLEAMVSESENSELHLEGLDAISATVRGSERQTPRKSRDLLVFQDISSTHREVFALYELAQTLGSTLNLHETLMIIAGKIEKIIPFTSCVIYLVDPTRRCLRAEHVAGVDAGAFKGHEIALGEGLSGSVAERNQPAVNSDPTPDIAPISRKMTVELDSALVYPLMHEDRGLGVIALYAGQPMAFKDDHVRVMEMVSKQAAMVIHNAIRFEETQEDAFTDRLTKLPNSRYLYIYFEQELQKAIRFHYPLTLLYMDLDGFKGINDRYGHPVGDRMLVEVARILKANLRGSDVVVRYAGDEFVAVMSQTSPKDAVLLAQRVQSTLEDFQLEVRPGKSARVGISIGMASYPSQGDSLESLIIEADGEMYRDKEVRSKTSRVVADEEEPVAHQLKLKSSSMK